MLLDNKINQVILQTWMKKHNIKHSSAMNGQEAVEKWKGGGFHLVLVSQSKEGVTRLAITYTTTRCVYDNNNANPLYYDCIQANYFLFHSPSPPCSSLSYP